MEKSLKMENTITKMTFGPHLKCDTPGNDAQAMDPLRGQCWVLKGHAGYASGKSWNL